MFDMDDNEREVDQARRKSDIQVPAHRWVLTGAFCTDWLGPRQHDDGHVAPPPEIAPVLAALATATDASPALVAARMRRPERLWSVAELSPYLFVLLTAGSGAERGGVPVPESVTIGAKRRALALLDAGAELAEVEAAMRVSPLTRRLRSIAEIRWATEAAHDADRESIGILLDDRVLRHWPRAASINEPADDRREIIGLLRVLMFDGNGFAGLESLLRSISVILAVKGWAGELRDAGGLLGARRRRAILAAHQGTAAVHQLEWEDREAMAEFKARAASHRPNVGAI